MSARFEARRDAVFRWLEERDFAGHDPYDGLASTLFSSSPLAHSALARLAWCQLFKRSPLDLRGVTRVPALRNPKALGLVLSGIARNPDASLFRGCSEPVIGWLAEGADQATGAWGYPFPWQNRAFYAPAHTPNAVCTSFVVHGLMDAADRLGSESALDLARGAITFFTHHIQRSESADGLCFSYTPGDRSIIHNVNLLVASVLARAGRVFRSPDLIELAGYAARHALAHQRPNGSWPYGEAPQQLWIDSFHTGFNLEALKRLESELREPSYREARARGFEFFRAHLLDEDSLPKYFDTTRYPIDAHNCAQTVLTLLDASDLDPSTPELAVKVADWTEQALGRGDGSYNYQRARWLRRNIVYARWSQAWMFRALSEMTARGFA